MLCFAACHRSPWCRVDIPTLSKTVLVSLERKSLSSDVMIAADLRYEPSSPLTARCLTNIRNTSTLQSLVRAESLLSLAETCRRAGVCGIVRACVRHLLRDLRGCGVRQRDQVCGQRRPATGSVPHGQDRRHLHVEGARQLSPQFVHSSPQRRSRPHDSAVWECQRHGRL